MPNRKTSVPVVEARVTRATVDRVAAAIGADFAAYIGEPATMDPLRAASYARTALTALGLTVEDDHA